MIEQVRIRARAAASRAKASCDVPLPDLADELVGWGWQLLHKKREHVIAADSPWGLVWCALVRRAQQEARGAELLTAPERSRRALIAHAHTPGRAGETWGVFDSADASTTDPVGDQAAESADERSVDDWDRGLVALHAELVDHGASPVWATEVISAGLDVLTTARRSYVHYEAFRDERLARMLTRPQVRALMNLLIGSRRGGAADSAWYALRSAGEDCRARLAVVHPKSVARLRVLVSAATEPLLWSA